MLLRLPLPYKVGETTCPGNANEKIRAEAAAYIWIRDNCPDVPMPVFLRRAGSAGINLLYCASQVDMRLMYLGTLQSYRRNSSRMGEEKSSEVASRSSSSFRLDV